MCGFAGFWDTNYRNKSELIEIAISMSNAISHRGPDASGYWVDEQIGFGVGHRRLSIIDLSSEGNQPKTSKNNKYVLSFNGEIYNHIDIRKDLEKSDAKIHWTGHSDTETLLAGFEFWGIEKTLNKTVGMFSMSIWDMTEHILYLTIDRMGEKPLYYGWTNNIQGNKNKIVFVFGSELKALKTHPDFKNNICRQALSKYLRFMYVPAPHSIYEDIYKLEPGCLLKIEGKPPLTYPNECMSPPLKFKSLEIKRWWSLSELIEKASKNQIKDENEALKHVEHTLASSVKLQSIADVPVGAFLSGGIDSSIIVALMQMNDTKKINTFTLGFKENDYDETAYAKLVSKYIGTNHTEIFVSALDAQKVIHNLPQIYDEPFADSSQIPTYLISKTIRQNVTVALSGDGGDELFGGYNRYFIGPKILKNLDLIPNNLRHLLISLIDSISLKNLNKLEFIYNIASREPTSIPRLGEKIGKLSDNLKGVKNIEDFYINLVSEWREPENLIKNLKNQYLSSENLIIKDKISEELLNKDKYSSLFMMYQDSMTYLPNDILCKVDRASMNVSLETRTPFLDHRVVDLAWRLPLNMKIRNGKGKWILKELLEKYIPRELIDRPKTGFGIPIGQWLRGPLRPWAENLINEKRLEDEGYFYSFQIRKKWIDHLTFKRDNTASLWAILMFQCWLESNKK